MFFWFFSKNTLERITEKSFSLLTNAWEFQEIIRSTTNQLYTPNFHHIPTSQLIFFKTKPKDSSTKKRKRRSLRIWCLAMVDHNKKKLNKRPRSFSMRRSVGESTSMDACRAKKSKIPEEVLRVWFLGPFLNGLLG